MINKIKPIKLLILDIDGVLTDGKIIYDSEGRETKNFNVLDGMGMVAFRKAGYKLAVISSRASKVARLRMKDLGVHKICLNAYPKLAAYKKILKELKVKDKEVCFVGDDLPDGVLLRRVGFKVAVPNGIPEVKKIADYVTKKKGGEGAVREVIELILKKQGRWSKVLKEHSL